MVWLGIRVGRKMGWDYRADHPHLGTRNRWIGPKQGRDPGSPGNLRIPGTLWTTFGTNLHSFVSFRKAHKLHHSIDQRAAGDARLPNISLNMATKEERVFTWQRTGTARGDGSDGRGGGGQYFREYYRGVVGRGGLSVRGL